MSEAQMEVGLYHDAEITLQRARRVFPEVPGFAIFKLTGREGQLAAALSSFEYADELLTKALNEATVGERGSPPGYTCLFLRTRADLRCAHGVLDEAQADYEAALRHATDPRWRFLDYEGHVRRGLGDLASRRLQEAVANAHFAAAFDIARKIGYSWLEAETFVAKAQSAFRFGNLVGAEDCAAHALELAEDGGWLELSAECFLIKAEYSMKRYGTQRNDYLGAARVLITRSGKRSLRIKYSEISGEAPRR